MRVVRTPEPISPVIIDRRDTPFAGFVMTGRPVSHDLPRDAGPPRRHGWRFRLRLSRWKQRRCGVLYQVWESFTVKETLNRRLEQGA